MILWFFVVLFGAGLFFIIINGSKDEPEYTTVEAAVTGINTEGYEVGEWITTDTVIIDTAIIKLIESGEHRDYRLSVVGSGTGHTKIIFGRVVTDTISGDSTIRKSNYTTDSIRIIYK